MSQRGAGGIKVPDPAPVPGTLETPEASSYFEAALHTPGVAPTRIPERHQQRKGPFPRWSGSPDGTASHRHPDAAAAGGLCGSSVLSHQTHPSSAAREGDARA